MSPKTLVNFFLSKIGLNKILFKLARSEIVNTDGDSANAALKRLEALSPFPTGSCVSTTARANAKQQVEIQIIVPCYNVQKYVYTCLNSIKPKHSYLVTVVNDGSTDGTSKILDQFRRNSNFDVIDKKNGGLSSARNAALNLEFKGKYLTFVDSDDYIDSNTLDAMLDKAISGDFDIVQGDFVHIKDSGKISRKIKFKHGEISRLDLAGFACGKIIKSNLFSNIKFPEGFYFEDTVMSLIVYGQDLKIFGFNKPYYFYRKVSGSISRQSKNFKNLDTLYIVFRLYEDRKKLGLELNKYVYSRLINQSCFLYYRLIGLGVPVVKDAFIAYSNFIRKIHERYTFKLSSYRLSALELSLLNSDFGKFVAAAKYL